MALNFPNTPTDGQQYTHEDRTWEWSAALGVWSLVPVSDNDAQVASNAAAQANLHRNAAEASANDAAGSAASALTSKNQAAASATTAESARDAALGHRNAAAQSASDAADSASNAANAALNTPLTGLDTSTAADVTTADTTLSAFGKLQARVASILTSIGLLAPKDNPTFTGIVSGVTKDHVGLGNVDNVSAADLRDRATHTGTQAISTVSGLQDALDAKAPINNPTFTGAVSGVTKAHVGLGNVDNTADADKPVSIAQAAAIASAKSTLVPNNQTGTAYTLSLADAGKRVAMDNVAANTVTVPPDTDVAFPADTIIYVSQDGDGPTTIAPGSGVTLNTAEGLSLGGQYKVASLIKTADDTWLVVGTVA